MTEYTAPEIPADFKEVTRAEFFNAIGSQDVTPSVRHDFYTLWETRTRAIAGWTTPGWRSPSNTPRRYALPVKH